MAINLGTIEARIRLRDELTGALKNIKASLGGLGPAATNAGKSMLPLSAGLAAIGLGSVKMATDFNASMANVATLIPGNVGRVNELKAAVQAMAIDTGKGTEDLAGGLYQVISAFGDTADTAKVLDINARAAAAGLSTTKEAIDLTSAVTKAYGDTSATAVQAVSDFALQTVKLGQTTFPELAASIGRVTPLAAELKVTQEELFGVMATATGVTGGAAEVSTQLRGVLQSLLAPTESMTELFGQMGIESGKALLEQQGLQGAMDSIVKAAESSGIPLQKFISSIEGQTLALSLTGAQSDTFTAKLAEMAKSAGLTDEAFKAQTDGVNKLGHEWERFKRQMEVAAQNLGDVLIPILLQAKEQLTPVGDAIKYVYEWFKQLSPETQSYIVIAAGVFAALGPLLIAFGAIATSISALMPVLTVLGAGLGLLLSPIGLVVAAIVGLGVAWYTWGDDVKRIVGDTVMAVTEWFQQKLGAVFDWVGQKIGQVTGYFKGMYDAVVGNSFVPDMIAGIQTEFAKLPAIMVKPTFDATQLVTNAFAAMGAAVMEHVNKWTGGLQKHLVEFLGGPKSLLGGVLASGLGALMGPAGPLSGLISAGIQKLGALAIEGAKKIWQGIKQVFGGGEEGVVVNPARDQFWAQYGGYEGASVALTRRLEEMGDSDPGGTADNLIKAAFAADQKAEFDRAQDAIISIIGGSRFRLGTPNLDFMDFGLGKPAMLHGEEAVVPKGREQEFADRHGVGGLGRIEDLLREQQSFNRALLTEMPRAMRDAVLLAG